MWVGRGLLSVIIIFKVLAVWVFTVTISFFTSISLLSFTVVQRQHIYNIPKPLNTRKLFKDNWVKITRPSIFQQLWKRGGKIFGTELKMRSKMSRKWLKNGYWTTQCFEASGQFRQWYGQVLAVHNRRTYPVLFIINSSDLTLISEGLFKHAKKEATAHSGVDCVYPP